MSAPTACSFVLVQIERVVDEELDERVAVQRVVELLAGDAGGIDHAHLTVELFEVPFLRELGDAVGEHRALHGGRDRLERFVADVATVEDLLAAPVDHLALLVHHLVVLEHVFADLEVAVFDGALRTLDRAW